MPFADHRIMEYVFNVPWEMKYQNGVEKALLATPAPTCFRRSSFTGKRAPYPKTYHPAYEKTSRRTPYGACIRSKRPDCSADRQEKDARLYRLPQGARQTVVWAAHGRTAAYGIFYPDQRLDEKISPDRLTGRQTAEAGKLPHSFPVSAVL